VAVMNQDKFQAAADLLAQASQAGTIAAAS
jgi:hypothetical protein